MSFRRAIFVILVLMSKFIARETEHVPLSLLKIPSD